MKPQLLVLVILLGLVGSMLGARVLLMSAHDAHEAHEHAEHALKPLFPAPDFVYADQRGARVTKQSLAGQPWVANFIFTTCRTVCPLLTAKMVQLQRKLPSVPVRFISFSVDPEHDTQPALRDYAMRWAPDEARWSLLQTDAQTLPKLAAAFKVTADKNSDPNALDPIIHSSIFVLVDGTGVVRGVYDSEDRDQFTALAADVRTLASSHQAAPVTLRDGPALYKQLSCGGCHDQRALAPPLGGLLGKRVELDDSLLITADEAYLRESIVSPQAKRVKGYTLKMPTYDGVIGTNELTTLVQYIAQLPEVPAGPAPVVETDPVCSMAVSVDADTPSFEADGKTYHFCSETCRDQFAQQHKR